MVKRIPVWLDEEMISDIGDIVKKEDMKNRSEFISLALEFYFGYLNTQKSTKFISDILIGEMEGIVKTSEQRLSRLLLNSNINTEAMVQMYAHETEWTEEQIAYVKQEARKLITKRGDQSASGGTN